MPAALGPTHEWRRGMAIGSGLIRGEGHQHRVAIRVVFGHNSFRSGRSGGVTRLPRYKEAAKNSQSQERRKDHASSKGGIQRKQAPERRSLRTAHLLHNAGAESGWRQNLLCRPQGFEQPGQLHHAIHFLSALVAGCQVSIEVPLSRRRQHSGEVLFETIHYCLVHTFLPLKIIATTYSPCTGLCPFSGDPQPFRAAPTCSKIRNLLLTAAAASRELQPVTRPGARSRRCAAFTNFCRARNSFTLMVFSFMHVRSANSSTE